MKKLMKQMNMQAVPAERVEIINAGRKLVIENPEVTKMSVMGETVFQIKGVVREEEELSIPEEDIELICEKTGASREEARKALEACEGDLARAIETLKDIN